MNRRPVTTHVAGNIGRHAQAVDPALVITLILELLPLLLACAGSEIRTVGWMRAEEYWQPWRGIVRRWRERRVRIEAQRRWRGDPEFAEDVADAVVEELHRADTSTMLALYREAEAARLDGDTTPLILLDGPA